MKKTILFVILFVFSGSLLSAQSACIKDVTYTLVSLKQIPKARKMMEENCFPGNESSADVWLLRGNVFYRLHEYEKERESDPKYVVKWPDAIITANESFYKALELKPDIKPTAGLCGPQDGQLITAEPINRMAESLLKKKDYTEAIKLFNIVIRSYKVDIKEFAPFLAYAYIDLADCYKAMGDDANYKKILLDAAKLNAPDPTIYLNIYDIYKNEKDTVKCGEILNQARKIIPDSLAIDVKGYELDYFAMTGDTIKLKAAAMKMYEQYKNNPDVIAIVVTHLNNNKEYLIAEDMIHAGLNIAPEHFDLNSQMAYRFYYEAADYDKIKDDHLNAKPRRFTAAEEALKKANEILGTAVIWAEKAYNIYQDDQLHNIMYRSILVRLLMEVPKELQEKVDSYYKR